MKSHKIELEDLQKWIEQEDVTFASSTRERKKLVSTLHGGLKVIVAGKTVWEGTQPFSAVEAYNSITEKYIDTATLTSKELDLKTDYTFKKNENSTFKKPELYTCKKNDL